MAKKNPEKTSENKPARAENGQLLPGNTANPHGRPKDTFSLVALLKKELANVHPKLKKTYAEIFIKKYMDRAIEDGDVQAMKDIINRTDGLPLQNVNHTGDLNVAIVSYGDNNSTQLPAQTVPVTSPPSD